MTDQQQRTIYEYGDAQEPGVPKAATAGPTHTGDLGVEWRGVEGVPESLRYGKPIRLGSLWFATNLTPVTFFIGVIGVTIGLNFWQNVLALVLGSLIGSITVGLLSVPGMRSGYPQIALARLPFGKTVSLISVAAYAESVVFLAVGAIFGVEALQVLFHLSLVPALIIVFGLEAMISIIGYELIHIFEVAATFLSGLGYVAITIAVLTKVNQIHIAQSAHGGDAVGAFLLMTAIALGYNIGWSAYSADYCRYLPSKTSAWRLWGWVYAGLNVSTIWLYILGLAAGAVLPNKSPMVAVDDVVGGGAVGALVMVAIALGVIAYMCATDYSAGLQLLAGGLRAPRPYITAASSLLAGTVTWWLSSGGLIDKAENVILLSTYWVAAFAPIVMLDWHSRRGTTVRVPFYKALPSGWRAAVSLLVAYAACLPFSDTTVGGDIAAAHGGILSVLFGSISRSGLANGDLAYPVAFLVGGGLYALLVRFVPERSEAAATVSAGVPEVSLQEGS